MHPKFFINSVFFTVLTFAGTFKPETAYANSAIKFPERAQTEGRIELNYNYGDEKVRHVLEFSESMDFSKARSAVGIGFIGYEPTRYYAANGAILTVNTKGYCDKAGLEEHPALVPEIAWFLKLVVQADGFNQFFKDSPNIVGPTGVFLALESIGQTNELSADGETVRNRITYDISSRYFSNGISGLKMKFEVQFPRVSMGQKMYFTIKATVLEDKSSKVPLTVEAKRIVGSSLQIDYYNIESIDDLPLNLDRFKESFNLPIGRGCNKLLKRVSVPHKDNSFSMDFIKRSTFERVLLAYDSVSNLMRREKPGHSVSVWDVANDLLYHEHQIDPASDENEKMSVECSVLEVNDEKLGAAFRVKPVGLMVITMLDLLGATYLSYIGRGSIRNIPCLIYEGTLKQPPNLFGLSSLDLSTKSSDKIQYYLVYYVMEPEESASTDLETKFPGEEFIPLAVELTKHDLDLDSLVLVERLDIYDFHWSLYGWDLKAPQMFMVPSCFPNKDERLRVQLAVDFHQLNDQSSKDTLFDYNVLVDNRYKLEYDILENMVTAFNLKLTYLTHYEVMLKKHYAYVDMILGDRDDSKSLIFAGDGELNSPEAYKNNRVEMNGLSEDDCVLKSSLVMDVSMVVYCPPVDLQSKCYAVYSEREPTYKKAISVDRNDKPCQVYKLRENPSKLHVVEKIDLIQKVLHHRPFFFYPEDSVSKGYTTELNGLVRDFDVSQEVQLQAIRKYRFSLTEGLDESADLMNRDLPVKSFDSVIKAEREADCARLCDLDVHCRSYSYCPPDGDKQGPNCVLANLDIRSSNVPDQLKKSVLSNGKESTRIKGMPGDDVFFITFSEGCLIREKNYLDIFRNTRESIRLHEHLAKQFRPAKSNFECAKMSVDLERSQPNSHIAMFAYCPSLRTCIIDENLITASEKSLANLGIHELTDHDRYVDDVDEEPQSDMEEVACRLYRKKYETYFSVSHEILIGSDENTQVELAIESVEECARVCWMKFGHTCSSFDFCEPSRCVINEASLHDLPKSHRSAQASCLHYERNRAYDELKEKNLIGRHTPLSQKGSTRARKGFMSNPFVDLLVYILAGCGFVYGLTLGRKISDKVERVTILRQSLSAGAGLRASTLPDFRGFSPPASLSSSLDVDQLPNEPIDIDDGNYHGAIQLSQIKRDGIGAGNSSNDDISFPSCRIDIKEMLSSGRALI